MQIYDIAVVGGGAAGTMAAIRAGQLGKRVALLERNDSIGKKILLTGKGRCNITNTAPLEVLIEKFGNSGKFLRSAFFAFGSEELMNFFNEKGLEFKIERQGRVFPVTDNAISILNVLKEYISENGIVVIYNARIKKINIVSGIFDLEKDDGQSLNARKVILATGGASYRATGSSGDGFRMAEELGHTIKTLGPGLVPLKTEEAWVKDVQGLTLKNVRLTFICGRSRISSAIGEMLFTHFGVSGPLILDLSHKIVALLKDHNKVGLLIDLKPGLLPEQIEKNILTEIKKSGRKELKSCLKSFLPASLVPVFVSLLKLDAAKKISQITQEERNNIVSFFKALPMTITGALPIEEAMVTAGGVSLKEIDPRSMESKIVRGLYFAGEIMEGSAPSGGYNLQQAFSTGHMAGEAAAYA